MEADKSAVEAAATARSTAGEWGRRHGPAIAGLVVLHLIAFGKYVFFYDGTPTRMIHWDFLSQYYPWLVYASDTIRAGHLPLWTPYVACGTPFFLNPQAQLWSPVTLFLASTIGYTQRVAQTQLALTFLFAGIGTYALGYRLWRSRTAALAAAIGYSLSSGLFTNLEHMTFINSFALAPWLFWVSTEAHVTRPWWSVPVLAILVHCLIVSGYPGVTFMLALWLTAYHGYLLWSQRQREGLLLSAGGAVLGVGLSSVYWMPLLVFRDEFSRGQAMTTAQALAPIGSLTWPDLWTPFFHFLSAHPLPGSTADVSMRGLYFGALLIPFAGIAAVKARREPYVVALIVLVFVSLAMAMGRNFPLREAIHNAIPLFNFSRFPAGDSRYLFCLAATLLGGKGVAIAIAGDTRTRARATAAIALLMGLWLSVGLTLIKMRLPGIFRWQTLPSIGYELACAVVVAVALWALPRSSYRGLAVLLVLAIEMWFCVREGGIVLGIPISKDAYRTKVLDAHHATFDVASARLPRQGKVDTKQESENRGYLDKTFYVGEHNGLRLKKFEQLLSRGFFDWLLRGPRVVAMAPDAQPTDLPSFKAAARDTTFQITRYEPNDIVYEVTVTEPALLVFNEVYFPGWNATVRSGAGAQAKRPMTELLGLRALRVEAGTHTIVTTFEPRAVITGLMASGVSWGLLLLTSWLLRRRQHSR